MSKHTADAQRGGWIQQRRCPYSECAKLPAFRDSAECAGLDDLKLHLKHFHGVHESQISPTANSLPRPPSQDDSAEFNCPYCHKWLSRRTGSHVNALFNRCTGKGAE